MNIPLMGSDTREGKNARDTAMSPTSQVPAATPRSCCTSPVTAPGACGQHPRDTKMMLPT